MRLQDYTALKAVSALSVVLLVFAASLLGTSDPSNPAAATDPTFHVGGSNLAAKVASAPLSLRIGEEGFAASTPQDCSKLGSSYFVAVCTSLVAADWRAISPLTAGPSPEMYARILRGMLNHDLAVCDDSVVIKFVEAGSQVDAATAKKYCLSTIDAAWKQGQVAIYDPFDLSGNPPLVVIVK